MENLMESMGSFPRGFPGVGGFLGPSGTDPQIFSNTLWKTNGFFHRNFEKNW
jgi:hypothetical protein